MSRDLLDRLADKFTVGDECWEWGAAKNARGYGVINVAGRTRLAHRVLWEVMCGPTPEGLEPDHLCCTPACVRPDHLEWVTHRENVLRGSSHVAARARQTECVNGHPFTEENTYWRKDRPNSRMCKACGSERGRL